MKIPRICLSCVLKATANSLLTQAGTGRAGSRLPFGAAAKYILPHFVRPSWVVIPAPHAGNFYPYLEPVFTVANGFLKTMPPSQSRWEG